VEKGDWKGFAEIGNIGNGQSRSIIIKGTVNPLTTATITDTASVNCETPDPDLTNNNVSEATRVSFNADLAVLKVGPAEISAGDEITYRITVTNNGPNEAENTVITDTMPSVG